MTTDSAKAISSTVVFFLIFCLIGSMIMMTVLMAVSDILIFDILSVSDVQILTFCSVHAVRAVRSTVAEVQYFI